MKEAHRSKIRGKNIISLEKRTVISVVSEVGVAFTIQPKRKRIAK